MSGSVLGQKKRIIFLILSLLFALFLGVFFVDYSSVFSAEYRERNQSDFADGVFSDTEFNADNSWVALDETGLLNGVGTYVSDIKDGSLSTTWNHFAWTPQHPTGKELPDDGGRESGYPSGNMDMTGSILLMHMNDTNGGVADTSGLENHGVVNGGVMYGVDGKLSSALGFNGSNGYIDIEDGQSLDVENGNFVFSAWAKLNSKTGNQSIIGKGAPNALVSKGTRSLGSQTFSLAIEDDVVVTADTSGGVGLGVFDISDRENPIRTHTENFPAGGVDMEDGIAYITDYNNALLKIYDVSNPNSVSLLSQLPVGSFPVPIEVQDGYAYPQEYTGSDMYIIDVTDPTNPSLASTVSLTDTTPYGNGVKVIENTMFVATSDGRVSIYDISDKADPNLVNQYTYSGNPLITGIDVDDDYIYIADYTNNKLSILNNPCASFSSPDCDDGWGEVGENTQNDGFIRPRYLDVNNDLLYFARHATPGAVQVYDISDRTNPVLLGSQAVNNGPNAIESTGKYAYSALNPGALGVYEYNELAVDLRYDAGEDHWLFEVGEIGDLHQAVYTQSTPIVDTWYHVVGVKSEGSIKIYVNGTEGAVSDTVGDLSGLSPGSLSIGRFGDAASAYLDGTLDEVSIWNRDLSDQEIRDVYRRGALNLKYQMRTCDDDACDTESFIGPDGTPDTYYSEIDNNTLSSPAFVPTNLSDNQYFQYQAVFETGDQSLSPELTSVLIRNTATLGGGSGPDFDLMIDADVSIEDEFSCDDPLTTDVFIDSDTAFEYRITDSINYADFGEWHSIPAPGEPISFTFREPYEAGLEKRVFIELRSETGQWNTMEETVILPELNCDEPPAEEGPDQESPEDESPGPSMLPEGVREGDLIKAQGDPAVYYIGNNKRRHAFPDTNVFLSWGFKFEDVTVASSEVLASIPLGANITYKPGVRPVTFTSTDKVYAVVDHGVLRHISAPSIARGLYGLDWQSQVRDIPVTFFRNYSIADNPIDQASQFSPDLVIEAIRKPTFPQ